MKHLLFLILIVSLLLNCKQKESEQAKTEKETNSVVANNKIDTIVVYWETNFDTIRQRHEINIENYTYELELKTYSLNDSSIVKMNDGGRSEIYKDIYHDNVTDSALVGNAGSRRGCAFSANHLVLCDAKRHLFLT